MLHLAYPLLLLAAPAVIAFILLLSRRDRNVSRARSVAAVAIRSLGVLALVVAMAGPSTLRTAVLPPRVIFALDVSESVDDAALDEAIRAIESASSAVSKTGGTTGLIAFAGRPSVLRTPASDPIAIQGEIRDRVCWRRSESALRTAAERGETGAADRLATLSAWRESIDVLATRLGPATLAARPPRARPRRAAPGRGAPSSCSPPPARPRWPRAGGPLRVPSPSSRGRPRWRARRRARPPGRTRRAS